MRGFGVRLDSIGLSVREVVSVIHFPRCRSFYWRLVELEVRVQRGAILPAANSAVKEKYIKVYGKDSDCTLPSILNQAVARNLRQPPRGTDSGASHHRVERSSTLVRPSLSSIQLISDSPGPRGTQRSAEYSERHHLKKCFQTGSMRLDRYRTYCSGSHPL